MFQRRIVQQRVVNRTIAQRPERFSFFQHSKNSIKQRLLGARDDRPFTAPTKYNGFRRQLRHLLSMLNQRGVGFIGTDRNNLFPKSFVQGLLTLPLEFTQQANEVRMITMDVFESDWDFSQPCQFRRGKPAMSTSEQAAL